MRLLLFIILALSTLLSGESKPNIAVMDLSGSGLTSSDLTTLTNRLRTELFETERFTVVERGQMETILKEQGFQQTGCTDAACAVEAGQLLNVDLIILGSIDRISRVYSINIRAVSVKDGAIAKNVKNDLVDADVEDLMLKGLRNAARKLAGLDTLEQSSTPIELRGKKVVKFKTYKSGDAGSLTITVTPADAGIFVDDSSYGTGNMVVDYVPVGPHTVCTERAGYKRFREETEIYRNQETALNLVLKPKTPFSFSIGPYFFMKKTNITRHLVYHSGSYPTEKYIELDLNYLSDILFAPSLAFGWEFGKNYFGLSGYFSPGFHENRKFLNAQKDTFNFETDGPTYGGFFEFWRMALAIPNFLYFGPGGSLGYLKRQHGLGQAGNAVSATDTAQYYPDFSYDDPLGTEYLYFGGLMVRMRIGYKHVFILVTDRFLMGVKYPISTSSYGTTYLGMTESVQPTEFAAENTLWAGLQFRF
ncbi:MAG: hypothetical protein A2268_03065 [Candidatus Raymondbacteria bacterium RifOxyA12_full_50_37]|uniref:PEGA domain-containing protein n=1 Tax=Candidatus Raymondbacteria bacterium RIFOXYD12_FULL_49_13 TaxID=1817890 RepID=A0A1F7F957_UNCRA|nr:MAG: hypothetical protein A2268_03065 [Candidatus Raymondbacteria bacterium RifOxyA12_full_50_37]OGJ92949.1 MAG: hypothetical protein A2350_04930 [Candidatus Raymondbacteria bacterium RifOxyB12_full_50_8]OGJ98394.1 MAG: hypothetical protein A2453_09075 [Candidatus Raymondbacteria bacterium RIFOXYC2_FULL_50_21]OGK03118.1 MAG: hypothetical protein A2519_06910 [Candidatus Raymondbacteria bacterium RIFOXYD12_FULL_49_13]OGP44119.1 MAG: hypothetical protein A2324_07250 [Candidatus Raymondbacteria 